MFVKVVFPLPFRNSFTYSVSDDFTDLINIGVRVVVPFGNRVLTGFVIGITDIKDTDATIKPIIDIIDETPVFDETSLKFYEWISEYYLCSLGEALRYSVPPGSEVESNRIIISDCDTCNKLLLQEKNKGTLKYKMLTILALKEKVNLSFIQKAINKKNIYSALKSLEKLGAIEITDIIDEAKVKPKKVKFVEIAESIDRIYGAIADSEKRSPKQVIILLELLSLKGKSIKLSTLLEKTQSSSNTINALESKKLIRVFDKEIERVYEESYKENISEFELTDMQKNVTDVISESINKNTFKPFLLQGVTGSGKTQVYIELAKLTLSLQKTVLILVPEISLTPQMMTRFLNSFGKKVTLIHSKMSLGERYDSWRGILKGKYKVVIGPRSAMFAPLKNIGLIVVDEEHDASYKQNDLVPRFNARDCSIIKAKQNNCPVVLGSATPSIETMFNALTGKFMWLKLPERVDNAQLPEIKLIDMIEAKKHKQTDNIFSKELIQEIRLRKERGEGVIILQNRRGFATQIYCDDCGEIETCDDCSVGLIYHIDKNLLKCHYCGFTKQAPRVCKKCGSIQLKYFGTGTQRVEDELSYYLPDCKIERVDSDTLDTKGKFGEIMNKFAAGEIDILVGTQIVSKGLDFSKVTLVGVISAETTLWMPDFRADERTFQLLTQVAGRAGRSNTKGEVLIQTQNKSNFVLQCVLSNNYAAFFEREIKVREFNNYPPFSRLALIEAKGEDEKDTLDAINQLYKLLQKYNSPVIINPPVTAVLFKIKKQFRYQLILKTPLKQDPSAAILRNLIFTVLTEYNKIARHKDVKITVDIDPQSIL